MKGVVSELLGLNKYALQHAAWELLLIFDGGERFTLSVDKNRYDRTVVGDYFIFENGEFARGIKILEPRPTEVFLSVLEDRVFNRPVQHVGLCFAPRVDVIKTFGEEEIGDLFNDREWVRYTAGPECIP